MSRNEKIKFIRLVEGSELNITDALAKYDFPRSTYYRWKHKLRNQGINGLADNKPYRARTWNQLLPRQIDKISLSNTLLKIIQLNSFVSQVISEFIPCTVVAGRGSANLLISPTIFVFPFSRANPVGVWPLLFCTVKPAKSLKCS